MNVVTSVTAEPDSDAIAATCVRLNAKAPDAASISPVIERRSLSRRSDEVVVAIGAAGVNPSDVKAATGLMPYAVFPRGISVVAPGGGTTLSSSPQEKMYVVLDGRLQISNGESEVALDKWDSCRIAGGEDRRLVNGTNSPVTVLLVMPLSADERQRGL